MTKEELIKLGVSEEQALKIVEAQKKEMAVYVSKERFNEVNEAKKELEGRISGYDDQLKKLKASESASEELKKQIAELQKANRSAQEEYKTKLKDIKLGTAIKLAVAGTAQDVDIVASLIDRSKLIVGDDGKVLGLQEQVKELEKSKPFLFKSGPMPYKPSGGPGGLPGGNPFAKESYNLTKQGELLKQNPELAKSLAQSAGVNLNF